MASNFIVNYLVKNGHLYINLRGNFDGSSAMQLLNGLGNRCTGVKKIFINTDELKDIHPFGMKVFEIHLSLQNYKSFNIIFTGSKRRLFMQGRRVKLS